MENNYNGLEVAVIGMSVKFPQSKNIDIFWNNLRNGKELITFFNEKELKEEGVADELLNNPNYIKANGYLEDCDYFDAVFFGYSPEEAEIMDPQLRLFHEHSWKALEDAGYVPNKFKGSIGVYAGATGSFVWEASSFLEGKNSWENSGIIDKDNLATLIAYRLNLKGPALTIYTACSTSLVTINSACLGILSGQCDMAIAGGITLQPGKSGYIYQEGMISSPDGHNRTFDAKAAGTIGGSGVGVVVLKRLQDALDDRDYIYAVIKGTAVNNDGKRKVGFTAPSINGQVDVIRLAMQMAEVDPESISYVECHGTATNLGDPVEVESLRIAFNNNHTGNYCALGSVKSNTGHLNAASGVVGFVKTVLCLKNRMLVPSLHFENPNPKIEFSNSPFYVNTESKEWKNDKYPLRAGVNSLGVGGTNAHVVLEEAPEIKSSSESREYKILLISSKTKSALDNNLKNLGEYFKAHSGLNLADAAYTLQVGRDDFKHRIMVVCKNLEEAIEKMGSNNVSYYGQKDSRTQIVFMFPGQGAQYVNMGRDLYENEKFYREEFDKCNDIFKGITNLNLVDILYPTKTGADFFDINKTAITQPVVFVFEYVLAKLLIHWGVKPDSMIGYSFGEYIVACLLGVFSFSDGLKLITLRGKLMESVPEGAMVSVPLSENELKSLLDQNVSLSISNGPSCIVGGSKQSIDLFEEKMRTHKVLCMRVNVSHASHSVMMDSILEDFQQEANLIKYSKPNSKYISGITGDWVDENEVCTSSYWTKHIRETVRFTEGIEKLLVNNNTIFIEVGPGRDLGTLIRRYIEDKPECYVSSIIRAEQQILSDYQHLTKCLGQLWIRGVKIDWDSYYENEKRFKIPLPTYEFDKLKFESKKDIFKLFNKILENRNYIQKKRRKMSEWFYTPSWEQALLFKGIDYSFSKERLLVFCNQSEVCKHTINMLKEFGHEITEVWSNQNYKIIDSSRYEIKADDIKDYVCLKNDFTKKDKMFDKLLHFWSYGEITGDNENTINEIEIDAGYRTVKNAIIELLGFLNKESQIVAFTSGAYSINGMEILCPERGMTGMLLKVVGQENPNIGIKVIDLEYPCSSLELQLNIINNEIFTKSVDRLIAYRQGKRLVESYRSINIEIKEQNRSLKTGGVYIITGGLGGIGLDIGEYIGKAYKAKVVLIGRKQFPKRSEWEKWIKEKGLDDSISKKINLIREIESDGGIVRTYSLDVSDKEKLEYVFNESQKEFGCINGVFHFAGVTNQEYLVPITNITQEIENEYFKPKLFGLMVLRHILKKHTVDFCLVTSSVSSILGGLGFGAYACSNIYMNGLIDNDLVNETIPWIIVDLDGWVSIRNNKDTSELSERYVVTSEGIKLIESILYLKERGVGHVVQSISDLNDRLKKWVTNSIGEGSDSEIIYETQLYSRSDLSADYVEPKTDIEKRIAQIWSAFFGYEKNGIRDDFFELGGDSLKAMRLFAIIHKEFGVRIGVKEIFKRPNIQLISEYISDNLEVLVV